MSNQKQPNDLVKRLLADADEFGGRCAEDEETYTLTWDELHRLSQGLALAAKSLQEAALQAVADFGQSQVALEGRADQTAELAKAKEAQSLTESVVREAISLRNSGYDGPFIGDVCEPLFSAVAEYERHATPLEVRSCPSCGKPLRLVAFHDRAAYQCQDCIFSRWLPDGTEQNCCVSMTTGQITWRTPKGKA